MSTKPVVCGCIHEPIAFNHFPPCLGKGRHTEFHSSGHGPAVPGGVFAATVLLPNSQPGKIGTLPDVAKRKPELRRKGHEISVIVLRICKVCREPAGRSRAFHMTEVGKPAFRTRSHRPGEL